MTETISSFKKGVGILSKREKFQFAWSVLIFIFTGIIDVVGLASLLPLLFGIASPDNLAQMPVVNKLYDWLGFGEYSHFLVFFLVCVFTVFAMKNIVLIGLGRLMVRWSKEISNRLSMLMLNQFYQSGYTRFFENNSLHMAHRFMQLPYEFASIAWTSMLSLLSELIVAVMLIAGLFFFDPVLGFALLAIILMASGAMGFSLGKSSLQLGKLRTEIAPDNFEKVHKLISGFMEFKIYGASSYFMNDYQKSLQELNAIRFRNYALSLYPKRWIETIGVFCIASLGIYLVLFDNPEKILIWTGVLAIVAYRLLPSLIVLIQSFIKITNQAPVISQLSEFINKPFNESQLIENVPFNKSINVAGLDVLFGERTILQDLHFEIKKGHITGLMGNSGSGKSTLAKVILGFISAADHVITIDGQSISNIQPKAWHRLFGYLSADSVILNDTVQQNILLGTTLEISRLNKALENAGLAEFINENRIIGENGKFISTGQKQRLALARALYHRPQIIILDEFASNLDEENEKAILATLKTLNEKEGITIFLISHRKWHMEICHSAFKINEGKCVEL